VSDTWWEEYLKSCDIEADEKRIEEVEEKFNISFDAAFDIVNEEKQPEMKMFKWRWLTRRLLLWRKHTLWT